MTIMLSWYGHDPVEIKSIHELEKWLDRLSQEGESSSAFTVSILAEEDKTCLALTVGRNESHIEYYDANSRPPADGCRGPWDSSEIISFLHDGELCEMEKRYFVPIKEARESARIYYLTRKKPDNVHWGY